MYKCFWVLCFLLIGSNKYADAQNSNVKGKTFAIIIGISNYQSKAIPPLNYADKDALLFADYLQSNAGGNVPSSQIKVLTNASATIASVYDALDWLKEVCSNGDLAYFYFSGHGDVETQDLSYTLGYLLAYNSPPNNYRNNAISITELNNDANYLTLQKKAKVVLVTDACRSGKLAGDVFKGKQLVGGQLRRALNDEVRLASCSAEEEAAEGPDWGGGRGVFSYYLLRGLNGFADLSNDGTVKLQELQKFLAASFTEDKHLQLQKHKQNPVTDGNPEFSLVNADTSAFAAYKMALVSNSATNHFMPAGLDIFQNPGIQPIDYFFSIAENLTVESYIQVKSANTVTDSVLPFIAIDACLRYADSVQEKYLRAIQEYSGHADEAEMKVRLQKAFELNKFGDTDTLKLLRSQLSKNKSLHARFKERLIQLIHDKAQEMINAYLAGDVAELEKRQYYYSGERNYTSFLEILELAIQIIPKDHHLYNILNVNKSYLSGVIARLNMATSSKKDSLLNTAFFHLRRCLQLEPYAAYIHNELGNLYLHKNKYDSAAYHFDFASDLTPAWAIPWSNKIRMSIMQKRWTKAKEAFVKADSLQPNLSYVLMNGGLVMEQEKDWLAAESYYLKSIEFNDVHFFPYERLAGIYLHTGAYLNADYFFSLAKTRKENFSLNDTYFKFGIELGGQVAFDEVQPHPDRSRLAFMESTAQKIPGNPLLEHYMGEHFYKTGLWEKAERALLKAVDQYLDSNALRTRLQSLVSAHAKLKHDTSLVSILMGYQYDKLEDHYLLAGLYERKGFYEQAIEQYKIIESIENRRQMTQATFGGLPFSFEPDPSNLSKIEDVVKRYEATHKMTGVIKLARLYERLGRLSLAEETLLNQVKRNRAAGLERQQVMNTGKTNLYWKALGYKINFYYLNINRNLEVETFNFYDRITKMLPRDYEWKEKAGMFLYNRLLLAYERMPVEEYPSFTESIERYDYPWTGKGDVVPREETITLNAPGTAEEITIKVTLYHPVFVALEYLKQSVKLYGDEQPRGEILTAITNLYSWSGAFDTAIHLLSKQVAEQPGDASLRNKLIDILMYNGAFPQARQHLDTLYNNEQLRKDQLIELVGYHLLTGNHKHAAKLLNEYKPENELENLALLSKKALMNFIQGKQENALKYLVDSFPVIRMKNDFENGVYNDGIYLENEKKKEFQIFQFYLTARLYALLQKDDKAFLTLKAALDSGFVYKNVLDNDAVWKRLKTSSKWENLISKYNFIVTDAEPSGIERSPLEYILPPSGNKYSY